MLKSWMSNKGSTLPMVMAVLIIVVIFSVTALTIGTASIKQAENRELQLQAYYLARSGTHAVASHIIKQSELKTETEMNALLTNLTAKPSDSYKLDPSDVGYIVTTVTRPSDTLLVVSSSGTVEGVSQTVSVDIIVEKKEGEVLTKAAYSLGDITMTNGNVYGDIFSKGYIKFSGGAKVHGKVYALNPNNVYPYGSSTPFYDGEPMPQTITPVFPSVDFPVFPTAPVIATQENELIVDWSDWINPIIEITNDIHYTNGIFAKNKTLNIYKSSYQKIHANRFTVSGGAVVNIDGTNGGLFLYIDNDFSVTAGNTITIYLGDSDINIVMKELSLSGNIIVNRTAGKKGKLNLYISEEFNFNHGEIKFNGGGVNDTKAVNIYYSGTKKLTLGSNVSIPGLLHVKAADLELTGGSSTTGSIICGGENRIITIKGGTDINTDMIYAPLATVNFSNGTVTGCIISNELNMSGGAKLYYEAFTTEFEEWTGGSGGKTKYRLGNWY